MLSNAVMNVVQVFPSLWCWVWLVLLLRVFVFHPSWCEVTLERFDAVVWARFGMVETVGFHQVLWLVMLESTKDQVLGVDTLGQHVTSSVWYGTACLLIRNVVCYESCSAVWEKTQNVIWSTRCKRGSSHEETLALQVGTRVTGKL
jgi:ABC-type dipeptide/oligopeptide/nickel transport system permease subunit